MARRYKNQNQDWRDEIDDQDPGFEKIARGEKAALPVSSSKVGGRSAKETPGSRKVRRMVSQKSGGIHRRRNKKIY